MIVFIKEKSWLAKKAAQKLGSPGAALVVRKTIHLWGVTREEFLQTSSWVRHEVAHVYQYKKYGLLRFLFCTLLITPGLDTIKIALSRKPEAENMK